LENYWSDWSRNDLYRAEAAVLIQQEIMQKKKGNHLRN